MISRAQFAAPTMNATKPRSRRVRRVVCHDVATAALAAAVEHVQYRLYRPLVSLPHILYCYIY